VSLERETAGTDWKSMAEQALSLLSNAFNLLDASTTERVSPMERGRLAGLNFHSVMCVEPGFFFGLVEGHISQCGDGCMGMGTWSTGNY
jgi:hypothetical protein